MNKARKKPIEQVLFFFSIAAYLVSLFLTWWEVTIIGDSEQPDFVMRSDGLGSAYCATRTLSELCAILAVAILIIGATALRSRNRRLLLARRQLAFALVIFNALTVLELWRSTAQMVAEPGFYRDSHISYGAWVAIGASLLVVSSVLVLDAGGMHALFERARRLLKREPGEGRARS